MSTLDFVPLLLPDERRLSKAMRRELKAQRRRWRRPLKRGDLDPATLPAPHARWATDWLGDVEARRALFAPVLAGLEELGEALGRQAVESLKAAALEALSDALDEIGDDD